MKREHPNTKFIDNDNIKRLPFTDELPLDGVYYRADGVSMKLRSFPVSGPVNIYKDTFKIPNAFTGEVPLRIPIPDDKKSWSEMFPSYKPENYITEQVLENSRNRNRSGWADPEPGIPENSREFGKLFKPFNPIWLRGISRDSSGEILHPYGRTGIRGQGVLGNRHVNEAVDPILVYFDPILNQLKVLLVKRNPVDTTANDWAIPGGMVDYRPESGDYSVPARLSKMMNAYKMGGLESMGETDIAAKIHTPHPIPLIHTISELQENALRELHEETGFSGKIGYQKLLAQLYADDVRTTDSTWIVTSMFLLIAEQIGELNVDGVEVSEARWTPYHEIGPELGLFASHKSMIDEAVKYYTVNSFIDRELFGTSTHEAVYTYLSSISSLDLPPYATLLRRK